MLAGGRALHVVSTNMFGEVLACVLDNLQL